ncbi:hypothetical protein HYS84_02720 [Candidatus Saccharibacteria bacterium]|nr:hypothetical protein [Candidatus Saccharibacteria bacterium]
MADTPETSSTDPSLTQGNQDNDTELDRVRLNEIIKTSMQPGVLFGRGLELSDDDREQLHRVVSVVGAKLEPHYEDPEWKRFMALVDEGVSKGVLISFVDQEGTNVPGWCINGGDDPEIKKILRKTESGEVPAIQVPQKIFDLYHWQRTVGGLDRYITTSNEGLKGTMARGLGEDLGHLAFYMKQT